MHELSICQSLLDQVQQIARPRQSQCVRSIVVGIGPLSGVEAELLKNAYSIARAGTLAAAAELVIENLPLRVKCTQCGSESDAQPNKLICKTCGDWRTTLVSGDELLLMSIEFEEQDEQIAEMMH
jgi:hydrogenase nickel incorporation protein HypA/HybF